MNSNYKKPELAKPQFVCKNIINKIFKNKIIKL